MLKCNKTVRQNGEIIKKKVDETNEYFHDVMEIKLEKIITKLKELKVITNDPEIDAFVNGVEEDIKFLRANYPVQRIIRFNGYTFEYRINPIKCRGHIYKAKPDGYSSTRNYF